MRKNWLGRIWAWRYRLCAIALLGALTILFCDWSVGHEDFPSLKGFEMGEIRTELDTEGEEVYLLTLTLSTRLNDLEAIFAASKAIQDALDEWMMEYDGWGVPNSAR